MAVRRWAWAWVCATGTACAACSGSATSGESERSEAARTSASSPLIGGTVSDASQDEVVLLIHHSAGAEVDQVCSGTLLAPNLVLTARHCVAATDPTSVCLADGSSVEGAQIREEYAPTDLFVFAGAERPTSTLADRTQRGSAILDDQSSTLCNHDLALVLLATPVPNAKVAPVRLDGGPQAGEPVTLVGWGITDASDRVPTMRQQRTGEPVLAVGPSEQVGLGSAEIEIGEGPCEGDSGGPALAASGAVIGALSRGGNGSADGGVGACTAGTSIYTAVSGFKDLLLSAYARAGQAPFLEGEASPGQARATAMSAANGGGCAIRSVSDAGPSIAGALAVALGCALCRRRRARTPA